MLGKRQPDEYMALRVQLNLSTKYTTHPGGQRNRDHDSGGIAAY
jgi:hypothetical protein